MRHHLTPKEKNLRVAIIIIVDEGEKKTTTF